MRSRDDAYRSYLRSLSASALARYKQLRRSVKNLLDTAKNTYISNKLASASSPADYWRTLRGIGIASHSTPSPLKFFTPDQLCRYYASVSSASPAINADAVTASLASASDQLGAATFGFRHVTPLDVELALKKCRSSSCGSDGISASVLRLASPALYNHLAEVFNLSFDLGVFPTVWKSASVVALAKVPSPASPSDTRPISLLPEMSKSVRKTLATALVLPHLDYAPAVYDSVTQEQNLRLQRVQNACVRFVYGSIPRTAHITPYRLALGWLSVHRRREMRIALLALEILRGGSPSQLRTPFKLLADHPEIRTSPRRIRPLVYYNAKRTGALTKSFTHTASRILSTLPFEITLANPASTYKKLIFNHLFSLDKNDWKTRCITENLTLIPPSLTNILTFT
ncbi:unnamed protein product [Trichogramma brassicae]|uniref:Reverse transcriptase domain-containing protein n=1 Tax=Trichogramma brassicae TaxID=86971 RepID=A0A6H5I651_9HYME|nr:unnamed protein product [Trichogramma brassicae]